MVKKNNKKPQPKKKTDPSPARSKGLTGQAFMIFIISACMFTLGVFVGRGTAPVRFDIEKLQKELAVLREAMAEKERNQAQIYRQAIDTKAGLGFYEALKKTGAEALGKESLQPDAKVPSKKQATAEPGTGSRGPAPKVKTDAAARGKLTVQVASVKDMKAADEMVAKLKKKGYSARRVMGKVPGKGIWFRVRIGYFDNKADAGDTLRRLKKDKLAGILVNN